MKDASGIERRTMQSSFPKGGGLGPVQAGVNTTRHKVDRGTRVAVERRPSSAVVPHNTTNSVIESGRVKNPRG